MYRLTFTINGVACQTLTSLEYLPDALNALSEYIDKDSVSIEMDTKSTKTASTNVRAATKNTAILRSNYGPAVHDRVRDAIKELGLKEVTTTDLMKLTRRNGGAHYAWVRVKLRESGFLGTPYGSRRAGTMIYPVKG